MPAPLNVARASWEAARTGDLWTNLGVSTLRALAGFAVGGGFALGLGLPNSLSRLSERLTDTSVQMVRNVPHLSLIPLVILWPATLSGGQRQRVALARALVSRPGLLALDEPLGALDALTRIGMQDLIERIWRAQGFTALLVTHDVGEAVALVDRILVLDAGRVALDLRVDVPRPRRRGDPALAALEGRILEHLLGRARTA